MSYKNVETWKKTRGKNANRRRSIRRFMNSCEVSKCSSFRILSKLADRDHAPKFVHELAVRASVERQVQSKWRHINLLL